MSEKGIVRDQVDCKQDELLLFHFNILEFKETRRTTNLFSSSIEH